MFVPFPTLRKRKKNVLNANILKRRMSGSPVVNVNISQRWGKDPFHRGSFQPGLPKGETDKNLCKQ